MAGGRHSTAATHDGLLARLDPRHWVHPAARRPTDQRVLNLALHRQATLIGPECNFPIKQGALIAERHGLTPEAARVLHFNLDAKPWRGAVGCSAAALPGGLSALSAGRVSAVVPWRRGGAATAPA